VTAAVVAGVVLVPLALLGWRSVTPDGSLSLDAYRRAFADVPLGEVAWNTAVFALGASVVGLVLGSALAFVLVRTDLPARRSLFVLAVAPLVLPGVLQTIAWIFLAAPRSGLLSPIPGVPSAFGAGGMTLVEGLRLTPLALLLVAAAIRSGDPAVEEAALVAGAGRAAVFRRVTLPLLRPALAATALLLLLRAVGSFEVPALLGIPAQTWVFTSRVWLSLGGSERDGATAAAASMPLLALTFAGAIWLAVLLRRTRAHAEVTGRAHRPPPLPLGRLRWPVLAGVAAYLAATVVLPVAALVWMSTQPFLARPSGDALARASLDAYGRLLHDDATFRSLANSVVISGAAAVVAVALAIVVARAALRGRGPARNVLDAMAFLPLAIPGLVLGVALLHVFLWSPVGLYGTEAALVLGYVARYLPYAARFAGAGLARFGRELEEAASVGGAGWWPTVRRVTVPLAAAAVAAAWLAVFTVAFTDVSLSLVLVSPGTEVVGTRIWSLYASGGFDELAAFGVVTLGAVLALALATVLVGRVATRRIRALD
jgi:iron(III) transport system permease protein